jgi:predicted enzyme related to lactoylglutathione lyase
MTAPVPAPGTIGWADLTVPAAEATRDFYAAVVGWQAQALDMGGYSDFIMNAPGTGAAVAGVCHARGGNAAIPAVWLIYITVSDLDTSLAECSARGGEVVVAPRTASGAARFAVIRDPAGAIAALYQP